MKSIMCISLISLHTEDTPYNTTTTQFNLHSASTVEEKIRRLGKLKERYLEKRADQKMQGSQNTLI